MKTNRKVLYSILLILLVTLAGVSSFFLYYFYKMRNDNLSFNKIDIKESSNVNYSVLTKDQKLNDSNKNKTYNINDIASVKSYFNYVLTFSSPVSIDYSYVIEGKLVNDDNTQDRVVYKNVPTVIKYSGKVMNVSSAFDIDVPEYLKTKEDLEKNQGINNYSRIEYTITISYAYSSNVINKSKSDKKVLKIQVPISNSTKIENSESEIKEYSNYSEISDKDKSTYLAICLELFGSTLLFVLTIILVVKRIVKNTIIYRNDLNTLLKKNKKYIVKLKNLPDFDNTDVLFVDSFDDLLDACFVSNKPINYFEIVKDKVAVFTIFDDFKAYVYKVTIRNED